METFITALTWGLGVSLGAAVGLLVFTIAKLGLDWVLGRTAAIEKVIKNFNEDSLEALVERNELTVQSNKAFRRIGEALEKLDQPRRSP